MSLELICHLSSLFTCVGIILSNMDNMDIFLKESYPYDSLAYIFIALDPRGGDSSFPDGF